MRMLEREADVAMLREAIADATTGRGSVVLVLGETGIGKTTLVSALPDLLPSNARMLVGWCDDLANPRVLGPLRDFAQLVSPPLAVTLRTGDRDAVCEGLLGELSDPDRPTILVIEDVHWADGATLDVLRFLVRRLAPLPVALVLTCRDGEVAAGHSLWGMLELASRTARVRRTNLQRLSAKAVQQLSADTAVDADRVFAVTGGNPYFVTEVLSAGDADDVPLTISDAVRGRLAGLDAPTALAVDRLAVIPFAAERWLVEALVPQGLSALAVAERMGLIIVLPDHVSFRHELTRRAVVQAMDTGRLLDAHRQVLAALRDRPGVELSRIMHHATLSGDRTVVVEVGPRAAEEAIAAGAHLQALDHLRSVLDPEPDLPPTHLARLWQERAAEAYTVDAPVHEAVSAQLRAVELFRDEADRLALGAALRLLSRIQWWAGHPAEAEAAAEEAIVIAPAADVDEKALALSNGAQLDALAGRDKPAMAAARLGLDLEPSAIPQANLLNNLGLAHLRIGEREGFAIVERSVHLALAENDLETACRAYAILGWHAIDGFDLSTAERYLREGTMLADRVEFLFYGRYLHYLAGWLFFLRGEWQAVQAVASPALSGAPAARCAALTLIGRLAARRGEPHATALLEEAWQLALGVGEAQRIGPAGAALAEAAWLSGRPSEAWPVIERAYLVTQQTGTPGIRAEIAFWRRCLGIATPEEHGEHPYALLTQGRWLDAEDAWRSERCPYEAALAAANGGDQQRWLAALVPLDELAAAPLSKTIRSKLLAAGVRHIPRGPTKGTRANPAGLTPRQVDVARLLVDGLTNAQIAGELVLSIRTVDSHVSAILQRLGVSSRRALAARASEFGLQT